LCIKVKEKENDCDVINKYKALSPIVRVKTILILLFVAAMVFILPTENMKTVDVNGLSSAVLLMFIVPMNKIAF